MYNSFSPNMIKTYLQCPKKYFYRYEENINIPQSTLPFEKGKKIHALANYHLQKIKIDRIETALNLAEKEEWELLKTNPFYNFECVKTEFPIMMKIKKEKSSYWIGGRLDAIVKDNQKYYILDYKTGKIPQNPEFDPQTMIYLLCADKYIKNYDSLSFVYISLKEKKNYVIEFNSELKSEYEKEIFSLTNKIYKDSIFKKNPKSCANCEFSKICKI